MTTKLTFGEWSAAVFIGGAAGILMYIVFLPLGLLAAWMRVKMWEWFIVPYFHLPHISVWLMFALGIFLGMFTSSPQTMKKEFYEASQTSRILIPIAVQWAGFLVAWGVHTWILKG